MKLWQAFKMAFKSISGNKGRSFLTMLGIIIGIAAIITIVSTIQGTNEQIKENLIGAGNNVVTVQLHQNRNVYQMNWNPIPQGVRTITEETRREAKDIPVEEAAAAACQALADQLSLNGDDLVREGAKLLGYPRTGSAISALMQEAIRYAQWKGRITLAPNGNYTLTK